MSLRINDVAPDFAAETTQGPINFHEWIGDGCDPAMSVNDYGMWERPDLVGCILALSGVGTHAHPGVAGCFFQEPFDH